MSVIHNTVLMTEVARDFLLSGHWYWTVGNTAVFVARNPLQQHTHLRVDRYRETRDTYRHTRSDPPFWADTSLALATSTCCKSSNKSILGCNIVLKNCRNRALMPHKRNVVSIAKGKTHKFISFWSVNCLNSVIFACVPRINLLALRRSYA